MAMGICGFSFFPLYIIRLSRTDDIYLYISSLCLSTHYLLLIIKEDREIYSYNIFYLFYSLTVAVCYIVCLYRLVL